MIRFRSLYMRRAVHSLLLPLVLACAGCATTDGAYEEGEPVVIEKEEQEVLLQEQAQKEQDAPKEVEGEVPLAVAESEPPADARAR